MLEIIGFIALALVGALLAFVGAAGFFAATAFGSQHKSDYGAPLAALVVGLAMLFAAFYLSPFTIGFERAASQTQGEPKP